MPLTGEQKREYQRKWYAKRKQKGFELLGNCCAVCGETEELELDHIDPSTKVSHTIFSWSWERIQTELEKCQLLCKPCHKAKTKEQNYPEPLHGTHTRYVHHKCRCVECKAFRREYIRQWRATKLR